MTQPTEPSKPLGMSDFFALEAGGAVRRLHAVSCPAGAPNARGVGRLARGRDARALRGGPGPGPAGAARGLRRGPLRRARRALQPLRGVAAISDLLPLPDLLDGSERTIGELSRSGLEPPANVAELFQAAATAIARSARDVAERGRPDPEGVEFRKYADLLVRFMESEPDVVSIGSLYYNDSGPHIVTPGAPPSRPATLRPVELVRHR